ncbi:MAG: CoA-binding protein [Ktedonobacteraceae bacterium]
MVDAMKADSIQELFAPLFTPATIAVVGASSTRLAYGNIFIRRLRAFGFQGTIYPIHPSHSVIEDLPAYPSLGDTPEPVDYAYIAVPPAQVTNVLAKARGRVRIAQVITSGFAEVEGGQILQDEMVRAARQAGVRVLGPNCLGTYSPRGRLTYVDGVSAVPGSIGIISQSGGLSVDVLLRGQQRGLQFSGVVTVGNSADLGPADLLEFFLADVQTKIIGIYLEDVKDGQHFFQLLHHARGAKPVVLLIGGRTQQGQRAAASHSGALVRDERIWMALAKQTGAVLTDTLEQFLAVLQAFQTQTPRPTRPTRQVVLFGNGGGAGVLATDFFARHGLEVTPFEKPVYEALQQLNLPPGSSITNPIDTPAGALKQEDGHIAGRILEIILTMSDLDALVIHLNVATILGFTDQEVDVMGNIIQAVNQLQSRYPDRPHCLLVLRTDGDPATETLKRIERTQAVALGIPVYDELTDAGYALAGIQAYERYQYALIHNQGGELFDK